jgi:membrane fusion protein, multidrug efflux system
MLVRTLSDAVVIPDDAVQHGPDGLYVYVVEAGKALRQDIVLSQSADGRSVVSKGLSAGQQVIKEGQYRVQPGTMVATPEQAATNQPEKVD